MIKSIGGKKLDTAVFISGNGSNLKNLVKFSLSKKSPINIKLVLSNNKKAKGLNFSKKYKIESKIFLFSNRSKSENQILKYLKSRKIKLICLAGFMKILSKKFVKRFQGKILNIHPSLLPKYKGLNTHERALKNNEKYSGCTVHFVTEKLDSGKIILQEKVRILNSDNPEKLAKRILRVENKLYPKAIEKLLSKT